MKQNWERQKKTWKKKLTTIKVIQWKWDLNSLKPFKFEPKTKIGDIISSSNDDEEEGAEYKVNWISNNDWCECSAKAFVGRCSPK